MKMRFHWEIKGFATRQQGFLAHPQEAAALCCIGFTQVDLHLHLQ
jgi:hypothetical protein